MACPALNTLLLDAPVDRHFAQIHTSSDDLTKSVGLFLKAGTERGNGLVLIASRDTADIYLSSLAEVGFDVETLRRSGQLIVKNAEDALGSIMVGRMPDWSKFRRLVGTMLEEVRAFGRSTTRAYGEMVNVLWHDGQPHAAIRLEEFWNELARLYPFSLFCGYTLDTRDARLYEQPLAEIGRTHCHVVATPDDERFAGALDLASRDIYGVPLVQLVSMTQPEDEPGQSRLPAGQRTMLWIMRHLTDSSAAILSRARHYYETSTDL